MITSARAEQFAAVREAVVAWARSEDSIQAVVLVGSWARNAARMDSDVDVVVLTLSGRFVQQTDWVSDVFDEEAAVVRTADWGAITERRVRLATGLEIEFGFGRPSWATTDPLDPGTRRVLGDGSQAWYDPNDVVKPAIRASA